MSESKSITFISDFFHKFGGPWANGGAELNDNYLINHAADRGYNVILIQSHEAHPDLFTANPDTTYIISNFCLLSELAKIHLMNKQYIIIEHDHKYAPGRDVSSYKGRLVPDGLKFHLPFYRAARAVYGFSRAHSRTVAMNIGREVQEIGTSFWTDEEFEHIKVCSKQKKNGLAAILKSSNLIKGTDDAIQVAKQNNIPYALLDSMPYKEFIHTLGQFSQLIFQPKVFESFSRVVAEANMLGVHTILNENLPLYEEPWYGNYTGENLIGYFKDKRDIITRIILNGSNRY